MDNISPETVQWTAEQTLRMHREPQNNERAAGRCAKCPPQVGDCRLLRWALTILDNKVLVAK